MIDMPLFCWKGPFINNVDRIVYPLPGALPLKNIFSLQYIILCSNVDIWPILPLVCQCSLWMTQRFLSIVESIKIMFVVLWCLRRRRKREPKLIPKPMVLQYLKLKPYAITEAPSILELLKNNRFNWQTPQLLLDSRKYP